MGAMKNSNQKKKKRNTRFSSQYIIYEKILDIISMHLLLGMKGTKIIAK